MLRAATIFATGAVLVMLASSCGGAGGSALPTGDDPVGLDPAEFTAQIDSPWMPLRAGSRWVYRLTDPDGTAQRWRRVVTVLDETREVMGIETRVVHDVETADGRVVEETFDWYAQDAAGNVWYLGEDTKAFSDGRVSTAGSWEAGKRGALPGILFPASPEVGMTYRQEYYGQTAEDAEEILRLDDEAVVPYGSFTGVVRTRDSTPDESERDRYKYFAQNVGRLLTIDLSGSNSREELVEYTRS